MLKFASLAVLLVIGLSIHSVYAHQYIILTGTVSYPAFATVTWSNSTATFDNQNGNFTAYIDGRLVAWSDGQTYWRIPATIVLGAGTYNFTYAYKGYQGISDFATIVTHPQTVITLTPTVAHPLSSQSQNSSGQATIVQIDALPIAIAIIAASCIIALSIFVSRRRERLPKVRTSNQLVMEESNEWLDRQLIEFLDS